RPGLRRRPDGRRHPAGGHGQALRHRDGPVRRRRRRADPRRPGPRGRPPPRAPLPGGAGPPHLRGHVGDPADDHRPGPPPPRRRRAVTERIVAVPGPGLDGRECREWAAQLGIDVEERPGDPVAYGPDPSQEGDLWTPAGAGPHPVVVLFHGGFWYHAWERDLMDGLAVDLAARGIAAWNAEYRRVGAGGGWPVTGEDAARAT